MSKYSPIALHPWAWYQDLHIAFVVAERNKAYTQQLADLNRDFLISQDCPSPDIFRVPGSLELPGFASQLLDVGKYDIVLVFGVIIKGKTMHYEFISQAIFNGLVSLSISYPSSTLIAGVLTVEDEALLAERISDNYARAALNLWTEKKRERA